MTEENPYRSTAPPNQQTFQQPGQQQGDATGGVIPYKNMAALMGYYVGIFSLLPCIGLLLSPVAIVLGIVGLVAKSKNPAVRGTAHAVIAIVCGLISSIYNGGGVVMFVIGMSQP